MQLTKFTHACVRVVVDGTTLVVDPGTWTESGALDGADAVLVTHEHADHVDVHRLAASGLPVYAPAGVALSGVNVVPVGPDETFAIGRVPVRAVGRRHAFTFESRPDVANFGYLIADRLYHPGDALALPAVPVETLLLPISGPWFRLNEAIEFGRAIGAERALGIHDAMLSERGLTTINGWLGREVGPGYRWVEPGQTLGTAQD
jgi:L-ascorbate metabolism protein UlaG (beta-lactamase superfamily)